MVVDGFPGFREILYDRLAQVALVRFSPGAFDTQ